MNWKNPNITLSMRATPPHPQPFPPLPPPQFRWLSSPRSPPRPRIVRAHLAYLASFHPIPWIPWKLASPSRSMQAAPLPWQRRPRRTTEKEAVHPSCLTKCTIGGPIFRPRSWLLSPLSDASLLLAHVVLLCSDNIWENLRNIDAQRAQVDFTFPLTESRRVLSRLWLSR